MSLPRESPDLVAPRSGDGRNSEEAHAPQVQFSAVGDGPGVVGLDVVPIRTLPPFLGSRVAPDPKWQAALDTHMPAVYDEIRAGRALLTAEGFGAMEEAA